MRRSARIVLGLSAIVAASCIGSAPVNADPTCKREAKDEFVGCKQECKDDYRAAKLTCRNVDPVCGTPCVAARRSCRYGHEDILATGMVPGGGTLAGCATGTDGCRAELEAEKAVCGAPCNGDPTCDACVDAAQVASFVCRDTCREAWRADPAATLIKEGCKASFQACIDACPPAP